jgi:hypothetical protein
MGAILTDMFICFIDFLYFVLFGANCALNRTCCTPGEANLVGRTCLDVEANGEAVIVGDEACESRDANGERSDPSMM